MRPTRHGSTSHARARLALLGAALLAACSGPAADKDTAESKPSALVRTGVAQLGAIAETVTAYGASETTARDERSVVAPVDSAVTRLLVAVGDTVRAGQPVATLQPGPLVTLEAARTTQDAATTEAAFARAVRLRATGLVSDAEVETARAAAATARATAQSLQARLVGVARAPIAGVVQAVGVAPGGVVAAGTTIVTVAPGAGARMRLGLDLPDAARVRAGDPVRFASLTDDRRAGGVVLAVDPRADPTTRQASAYAAPPVGARFGVGEPIKGEITVATHAGVPLVPRGAVLYEGETPYVFVVEGGVARRRDLTLGIQTADAVEVRAGVKPGDRVALDGGTTLTDGMDVREAGGREAGGRAPAVR